MTRQVLNEGFMMVQPTAVRVLGPMAAIVLAQIHYRCEHDDRLERDITQTDLADWCGLSRDQVYRAVKKLTELGIVNAEARSSAKGNQTRTYSVNVEAAQQALPVDNTRQPSTYTPPALRASAQGVRDSAQGVRDSAQSKRKGEVVEGEKTTREPAAAPVDKYAPFEREFMACWDHPEHPYPRKTNRKGALAAFQARRRDGVTAEQLLAASVAYAMSRAGEDPKYTLHGATFWGPNERWTEWLQTARMLPSAAGKPQAVQCNCPTCHGSTWQPGAGIDSPLDPVKDRCTACAGTGTVTMDAPTELEPF